MSNKILPTEDTIENESRQITPKLNTGHAIENERIERAPKLTLEKNITKEKMEKAPIIAKQEVNLAGKSREKIVLQMSLDIAPVDIFQAAKLEIIALIKKNSFSKFATNITEAVVESWNRITSMERNSNGHSTIGKRFYKELFYEAPDFKQLFTNSMRTQHVMFASMIDNSIRVLSDLDKLIVKLVALGERPKNYNCHNGQFTLLGICLFKSLRKFDKEHWTEQLEKSWLTVFNVMSCVMMQTLPEGD
eukprot:Awhi_evm1s4802